MVTDGRGNRHQPKGVPGAGHFAPKGGAAGADDLAESTKFGMYRPHVPPGTMYGGALAAATRDGFDIDPYIHTRGGITADAGDMAEFRKELPVEPVAMGDREYGEAVTVEDGKLCLYSANTPRIPLLRVEPEEGEDPRAAAYRELGRSESVLRRFACDCPGRRRWTTIPSAYPPAMEAAWRYGSTGIRRRYSRMTRKACVVWIAGSAWASAGPSTRTWRG